MRKLLVIKLLKIISMHTESSMTWKTNRVYRAKITFQNEE